MNYLSFNLNFLPLLSVNYSDTIAIAQAMSDSINEIYVKNNIRFDIIVYSDNSSRLNDIVNEIQKINNANYAFQLKLTNNSNEITESSVILTSASYKINEIIHGSFLKLENNYSTPFKFLFYTEELHIDGLGQVFPITISMDEHSYKSYMNNYLIVNSSDGFAFVTSFIRQGDISSMGFEIKIETVSTFNSQTFKWSHSLDKLKEKSENFTNYFIFFLLMCETKFDCYIDKLNGEERGVLIDIINLVAQSKGFRAIFWFNNTYSQSKLKHHPFRDILSISPSLRSEIENAMHHITTAYSEGKYQFIITPPESYSSYEKLLLPFDKTTWIMLLLTFIVAYAVTIFVNKMSRKIQDLIYGRNIRMPGFNITSIFFGIGQTQLPAGHFPRFILMIFIIFCLIIRTAYQGVLFELITLDLRKSSPETIAELFERNFTFYRTTSHFYMMEQLEEYLKSKHLNFTINSEELSQNDFEAFYRQQYNDSSAKIAFFADDHNLNQLNDLSKSKSLILKEVLFSYGKGMALMKNHYLFNKIDDTIQRTLPFGIPQYLADYHRWIFYKDHEVINEELKPFTLESLSFGFVIWLVACGISFVGFIYELMHIKLRRHLRTLIGLILFLMLLNCRLKYGHYL